MCGVIHLKKLVFSVSALLISFSLTTFIFFSFFVLALYKHCDMIIHINDFITMLVVSNAITSLSTNKERPTEIHRFIKLSSISYISEQDM